MNSWALASFAASTFHHRKIRLGIDDAEYALRSGDGRKHLVELVGKVGKRPCELPCIFCKHDDGTDCDDTIRIEDEQTAGTGHNRKADVVQHVHHFRDEAGVQECPKCDVPEISRLFIEVADRRLLLREDLDDLLPGYHLFDISVQRRRQR